MKFYVEKAGFGNAVLYIIRDEDRSEQYTGPFLDKLKQTIVSRHLDAEFEEVDLDKPIYQPV